MGRCGRGVKESSRYEGGLERDSETDRSYENRLGLERGSDESQVKFSVRANWESDLGVSLAPHKKVYVMG